MSCSAHSYDPSSMIYRSGVSGRSLPRMVSAVEFVRAMEGRTHPALFRCDDGKYYVVKFHERCRHARALANEMFAGLLAMKLGLPVSEPIIVKVPQALGAECSVKMGSTSEMTLEFGSAYPHPPNQMLVADFLPNRLRRRMINAEAVFSGALVFDQWICNSGRREFIFFRPASEDGASYSAWLTDHDAAFNDGDWRLPKAFVPFSYVQRFVDCGARSVESLSPALARIENLGAHEIEHAARCVPTEWCPKGLADILNLADQLFTRRKRVRQALSSILPSNAA